NNFFQFSFTSFAMALTGAFWAYDGWNNLSFVAGEVKDPQRNIPRGLIFGLLSCTFIYILINFAFVYLLGMHNLSNSNFIATDVGSRIWGGAGAIIITIVVVLTTFGTLNSNVLSTARVTFALGLSNSIFSKASLIHPILKTPYLALVFNLVWSILLVLSGSFDILTDMLIFVSWLFYGMSALGVIILRFRMPDFPRVYKVWMYPIPTILFIVFTFIYLILTLYNDINNFNAGRSPIIQSVFGLIICLLGLPLYWLNKKKQSL
ncbi:MAG: amino acid permease, partial [Saprospiraceae bacterium]